MLNQQGLRNALAISTMNYKIGVGKVDLVWIVVVNGVKEPLLGANVQFNEGLVPASVVACASGLEDDLRVKVEKFTETMALIVLLRTKKSGSIMGEYGEDTEFHKKMLLAYDDICSKY